MKEVETHEDYRRLSVKRRKQHTNNIFKTTMWVLNKTGLLLLIKHIVCVYCVHITRDRRNTALIVVCVYSEVCVDSIPFFLYFFRFTRFECVDTFIYLRYISSNKQRQSRIFHQNNQICRFDARCYCCLES